MNKTELVAVYGSLLSGLGNHPVMKRLGDDHYELVGTTVLPNHNLFSLGGFPGVEEGDHQVIVEVYKVTPELLRGPLDRLEGYNEDRDDNFFYDRRKVQTEFGESWIYYYVSGSAGRPIIEDGDWRNFRTGVKAI